MAMRSPSEEPVFVCSMCGRGFLKVPGKLDPVPVWFTTFSQSEGPCLGEIRLAYRSTLIRNLDNAEKRRSE
jgi:hypothetical protein